MNDCFCSRARAPMPCKKEKKKCEHKKNYRSCLKRFIIPPGPLKGSSHRFPFLASSVKWTRRTACALCTVHMCVWRLLFCSKVLRTPRISSHTHTHAIAARLRNLESTKNGHGRLETLVSYL